MVQTGSKSDAVRRALPATQQAAYFNTGTCGPLPEASVDTMIAAERRELLEGRINMSGYMAFAEVREAARAQLARVLGCKPEEIALTHSTTEGVNYAVWGLNWREGDEAVTTSVEHIGGLSPLYVLEHRHGVRIRFADCGVTGEGALAAISAALSERTRAVVLSHVSYSTGYVLPLKQIVARAHQSGALVIVDGAQSVGAIPLDMYDLGVDAYAAPGQKWLCGPEGTGGLYVRADRLEAFGPTFAGYSTFATHDELGNYTFQSDARRFELGSVFRPSLTGFKASLDWLLDEVGLEWAQARIAELAAYCRKGLEGIEGVEIITPAGRQAGLVNFTVPAWDRQAIVEELADRDILIRSVARPAALRVSTGFYNTEAEVDRLIDALKELMRQRPHAPRTPAH